eukprot:1146116-Pelagomonas_calceolata.AAC.7
MPGPRSPRLPAPSLEAPTASDVSDAALEERADPAPFACASCSELGDAADAGSCAGSDEPSGDCFKDMASWNWPRRSIIALKPASDSNCVSKDRNMYVLCEQGPLKHSPEASGQKNTSRTQVMHEGSLKCSLIADESR